MIQNKTQWRSPQHDTQVRKTPTGNIETQLEHIYDNGPISHRVQRKAAVHYVNSKWCDLCRLSGHYPPTCRDSRILAYWLNTSSLHRKFTNNTTIFSGQTTIIWINSMNEARKQSVLFLSVRIPLSEECKTNGRCFYFLFFSDEVWTKTVMFSHLFSVHSYRMCRYITLVVSSTLCSVFEIIFPVLKTIDDFWGFFFAFTR